jgi:hypothetical protein
LFTNEHYNDDEDDFMSQYDKLNKVVINY